MKKIIVESTTYKSYKISILFFLCLILLLIGIWFSITNGVASITWKEALEALLGERDTKEQLIISTIRLPRAIVALLIGANLAVAGAIMQAITRNPFASPQILGINSGAAFMVVMLIVFIPSVSSLTLVYASFIGAALGGFLVFMMGMTKDGEASPVKLALAGIAVSMFLMALTEGLIVLYDTKTQHVLFWLAGSVSTGSWDDIRTILPWTGIGMLFSLLISRSITTLSLGTDIARGLGQNIVFTQFSAGCIVIILAGSSVSIAGPIGFVGLVIPHIVRFWTGSDYRLTIPLSALLGGNLLLYSDLASRYIAYPFESPVGIVTAAIGAPFFLYLIVKRGLK